MEKGNASLRTLSLRTPPCPVAGRASQAAVCPDGTGRPAQRPAAHFGLMDGLLHVRRCLMSQSRETEVWLDLS